MTGIVMQPIETCPREPGVPYVLLGRNGGPLVAEWNETAYDRPCWDLWLNGERYGLGLDASEVAGWFPVVLPEPNRS